MLFFLSLPLGAQSQEEGQLGAAALFTAAVQTRREGSPAGAVPLFRQAAADENFILADYAQFEVGEIYYAAGNYPAAIPEYSRVISRYPASLLRPRAQLLIGQSYLNLKNFSEAISSFALLIQKYPEAEDAAAARFLRGKALQEQGEWKEAYRAYEETDLYHPLSDFGKKARLAIQLLKRTHKKGLPSFKASDSALFKKGLTYFEQDDFEMAANIFNRLAREYPKSKYVGEAWLMLGRAEMQANKSSAIPDLQRAAQGPPNLAGKASYYLGIAYGRRGDYDKAIRSLKKVIDLYPDSDLADEAAYWAAYFREINGDRETALVEYHDLIKKYPYSKSVPAAIWRMGKIYYWASDFKNASTYLHLAQLYPPAEDTPRCYFFEAKALERLGNFAAASELYKKLAERFDHTYYAYRAQEKLKGAGVSFAEQASFGGDEFSEALEDLDGKDQNELAAIMEIWEQTNIENLQQDDSEGAHLHLAKYKELMNLGLSDYAADEARYLVDITSETEKDSAQIKLAEMLVRSGEYRRPIRFADRKVKAAVLSGKADSVPRKIWQLAYPRGYWKQVAEKSGRYQIDPYLVLAVIREESRFNPRATSRSNAKGLMQIIPPTGRGIAKNLKLSRYRTQKLYDPTLNVEMGSYYLANLVKRFSDNVYLALAGYNGGPNKIKRYVKYWYNGDLGLVDVDEFIESIPSRETRLYVQKVMGSYFEYKRLYERKRG